MLSNEVSVEIEILRKHGLSLRRIAQEVGCAVNTVRRHLALGEAPSYGPRKRRSTKLEAYESYLRQRQAAAQPHWIPATVLLREIGLLPDLNAETSTLAVLKADQRYVLLADGGLRPATASDRSTLAGSQWQSLHTALTDPNTYTATLRTLVGAGASTASDLKSQLRTLLQYHCGSPMLRTRQLMMDLQSL